jgi:aryl sulfotransferase
VWHLAGGWERHDDEQVVLLHYDDLLADLDGQMRLLADRLGIQVSDRAFPAGSRRRVRRHAGSRR